MGNTESLLINITSSLSRVDNELRALIKVSEYDDKRKKFDHMQKDISQMNQIILQELESVSEDEGYTGTLDHI